MLAHSKHTITLFRNNESGQIVLLTSRLWFSATKMRMQGIGVAVSYVPTKPNKSSEGGVNRKVWVAAITMP